MPNSQITHGQSPAQARSECFVAINPLNDSQAVVASKRFRDPHTYDFTLASSYTQDGGASWHDSADLTLTDFTMLTDPAVAWDDQNNVYLVGLTGTNPPVFDTGGIVIYRSSDGGKSWSDPLAIHNSANDDKQWVGGDAWPTSPHKGNVYAVWDDSEGSQAVCRFACTRDHGASWVGIGATPGVPGTPISTGSFYPELTVGVDGTVYVVSIAGSDVLMVRSDDGGRTFTAPMTVASGITTLEASYRTKSGWAELPGANFRVITDPTVCANHQSVYVAWPDAREGVSRIYHARSDNRGATWATAPSGEPLLGTTDFGAVHHFQPQIAVTRQRGLLGCTFYELGMKPDRPRIDTMVATPAAAGGQLVAKTLTDMPWDPTVGAPWAHADPSVTFIGDYFGFDADETGFRAVWTDTRTGMQELWTDWVPARARIYRPSDLVAQILFGIINDGGGIEIIGGRPHPVPPMGWAEREVLEALVAYLVAAEAEGASARELQIAALNMIADVAQRRAAQIGARE